MDRTTLTKENPYEVWGYDSFDHQDWLHGRYKTKEAAEKAAKELGGTMTLAYVYLNGQRLAKYGTF